MRPSEGANGRVPPTSTAILARASDELELTDQSSRSSQSQVGPSLSPSKAQPSGETAVVLVGYRGSAPDMRRAQILANF